MTLYVCPPPAVVMLDPTGRVPHHGFGVTTLKKNGRRVTSWLHYDDCPDLDELDCEIRQGVGWSLDVDGPLSSQTYRLRRDGWVLTERRRGFA